MSDVTVELLKTQFRQLRLPTMGREFERLARDAAAANQSFVQFLLRLTEIELEARAANAVATWIKNAEFPVEKDFDTYDFSVLPGLSKPKVVVHEVDVTLVHYNVRAPAPQPTSEHWPSEARSSHFHPPPRTMIPVLAWSMGPPAFDLQDFPVPLNLTPEDNTGVLC